MHITPIQMRFNDIDMMGHVNNAVIMEYLDLAKSRYFAAAGVPVSPQEGDFTVMVVHHEIDFLRQIHFNDDVEVRTHVSHFGTKSLRVEQRVHANGQEACRCSTVMSGYLRSASASAPIPETIKQRVRDYDAAHPE